MCYRCITPSWFDDFKKDWNQLAATPIDDDDHTCYFIDSALWNTNEHMMTEVNTQKAMAPQVESGNNITEKNETPCPRSGNNLVEMGENDEVFDPEIRQTYEQKVEAVKHMADHFEQELAANNFNYITRVINNMDRLFTMLNDIETAQNQRRHNWTWRGSMPWTLYLQ
ncbi:446_t:CDS:2 [Gigaspora margarita]|uniref:446_t:CDS:1 n=1 Tax=Gigaspora margarita TaxID=4874 RepID=A0ABN7VCZ1_GIGMA|nr:446_t:CDS:2 [Gigaspora margarita]